jgi:hypothetical protein
MTIPRIFEKPYTRVRLPVYMDHRRSYVPNNDGVGRQSTRRLHLHALRPPRTYEYIYTIRTHTYATTHVAALATCTAGGKRPDDGRRTTGTRTRRTSGARRGIPGFAAHASTCPSPFFLRSVLPSRSGCGRSGLRSLSVRPRNHRLLEPHHLMERWCWWFAAETYSE